MASDAMAASNDNIRTTFVRLANRCDGGEVREFGSLVASSSGLPVSVYNRIYAFDPPNLESFRSAVQWLSDTSDRFQVNATGESASEVADLAVELGLERTETMPAMSISLAGVDAADSPATIERVDGGADIAEFATVCSATFGTPANLGERAYAAFVDGDCVQPFVGRVEGEPAACGVLSTTGAAAGVYTIGVVESHRRRGIGEAMSRRVLRAGRDAGCEVGVLQAEGEALRLYEQIGFERVGTYHYFEPVD